MPNESQITFNHFLPDLGSSTAYPWLDQDAAQGLASGLQRGIGQKKKTWSNGVICQFNPLSIDKNNFWRWKGGPNRIVNTRNT
jgi:hypothetical protein